MNSVNLNSTTGFLLANTTTSSFVVMLPESATVPGRIFTVRDEAGTFGISSLTLSTSAVTDTFRADGGGGTYTYTMNLPSQTQSFIAAYNNASIPYWYPLNGNNQAALQTQQLFVSSVSSTGPTIHITGDLQVDFITSRSSITSSLLTSNIQFKDSATGLVTSNLYARSNLLYFNSNFVGPTTLGRTVFVDSVYGDDSTGQLNGPPFSTVNTAISTMFASNASNYTLFVMPGVYNLTSSITIPPYCAIRGANIQTTTLQMRDVQSNTTLITMSTQTRLEDLTINLTSACNVDLIGVHFPASTVQTAKIRTVVGNLSNTYAFSNTTSTIGILCTGATQTGMNLSFNCVQRLTMNVSTLGASNAFTRGFYIAGDVQCSVRDVNMYAFGGNAVAAEVNSPGGNFLPRITTLYGSTADIKQTSGLIQIAPGVDLVNKTASGLPFTLDQYPTTLYYGAIGTLSDAGVSNGYLWPGSVPVQEGSAKAAQYPNSNFAYYRVQQKALLLGGFLNIESWSNASGISTLTLNIWQYNSNAATSNLFTSLLVQSNDTFPKIQSFNASTLTLNQYDRIAVQFSTTGTLANGPHHISLQLDIF